MRLVGTVHRYIGVSTETKPFVGQVRQEDNYVLTAADLPVGSTFYEEDTGWEWAYRRESGWVLSPDSGRTGIIVAKIDDVIGVLREALIELRTANGHLGAGSGLEAPEALESSKG